MQGAFIVAFDRVGKLDTHKQTMNCLAISTGGAHWRVYLPHQADCRSRAAFGEAHTGAGVNTWAPPLKDAADVGSHV